MIACQFSNTSFDQRLQDTQKLVFHITQTDKHTHSHTDRHDNAMTHLAPNQSDNLENSNSIFILGLGAKEFYELSCDY